MCGKWGAPGKGWDGKGGKGDTYEALENIEIGYE